MYADGDAQLMRCNVDGITKNTSRLNFRTKINIMLCEGIYQLLLSYRYRTYLNIQHPRILYVKILKHSN